MTEIFEQDSVEKKKKKNKPSAVPEVTPEEILASMEEEEKLLKDQAPKVDVELVLDLNINKLKADKEKSKEEQKLNRELMLKAVEESKKSGTEESWYFNGEDFNNFYDKHNELFIPIGNIEDQIDLIVLSKMKISSSWDTIMNELRSEAQALGVNESYY